MYFLLSFWKRFVYFLSSYKILWKMMPGRLKQVPKDSTEWDRTDTGHCTDGQSNTSSILVTTDFEHTVKRYPVSWFSLTLNIKWYIQASWRTRKKLQPSTWPKSPSSSQIFGQRTPTCGSFMQRLPSETSKSHNHSRG